MSNTKANACPPVPADAGPGVNIRGCTIYKPADAHVIYTPTQGVPPSSLTFELLSFAVPLALIVLCFGLLVFFDRSK